MASTTSSPQALPQEIVAAAQANSIVLYLKGANLAYISEAGTFPDALKGQIRDNKDAIIAYLQNLERIKQLEQNATVIRPVDKSGFLPLSFAQQGLWFVDKLEGGSSQYNMPAALRLKGKVNLAAMTDAFNALIERHEVLRTVFIEQDGEACQVIQPMTRFELAVIDLSNQTAEARQQELQRLMARECDDTFDLTKDLMLRVKVVGLSALDHALLFTMHHIVSDGWSQAVLVREFVTLYEAFRLGQVNPLAPLEIQYSDYAHWQRHYYSDEKLASQLAFWQNRLAGAPKRHCLGLDHLRAPQQTFAGEVHSWKVEAATMKALKKMAKAHHSTLFMVLYSAFAVLLGRWSQTSDVVIGSPIAGRTHPQVAPLIGYFLNSILYRTTWTSEQTFAALLKQNREHTLASYDCQDIPMEALVDKLKVARELSHSPLFQLMFTLQNNEKSDLALPGLTIEPLSENNAIIKYDMEMEAEEREDGIYFIWNYSTRLFTAQSIRVMTDSFNLILQQIGHNADVVVEQLRLLPEEIESPVSKSEPKSNSVHGLFEQQVAQNPDAIAIQSAAQHITYQQLNTQANQLARHLLAQGLSAGEGVLVCAEHDIKGYVALLAVLKIGGHYHTIMPSQFDVMLADLGTQTKPVKDAQVKVMGTSALAATIAETLSLNVIVFDDESVLSAYPDGNIETSINHAIACCQIAAQQTAMGVSAQSTLLLLPQGHYFAATDWMTGLASGAKLVLADGVGSIEQILTEQSITHLTLTPALLADIPVSSDYGLECVAVAGEPGCSALLWQWAEHYKVLSVLNINLACYVSVCQVKVGQQVNLGQLGEQGRIVKSGGERTPAGAIGNLHIKAFDSGNHWLDCGLKVRQRNDGTIDVIQSDIDQLNRDQFLVESAITAVPGVNLAVCCDDLTFVCFKADGRGEQDALAALQQQLKAVLPQYLLPTAFMVMRELPLLADTRINRALLNDQRLYWRKTLKSWPEPEYFNATELIKASPQTAPFVLAEPATKALAGLASQYGLTEQTALSAVLSVTLAVHHERNVMVSRVCGLQGKNPVFVCHQLADETSVASVFNAMGSDWQQALDYRFVTAQWLKDNYNEVHHAKVVELFDHQLVFEPALDIPFEGGLTLQVNQKAPGSETIEGRWCFDGNRFEAGVITQLSNNLNLLTGWIEQQPSLSMMALKDKLIQEARNKVRSVKRKFKPVIKRR